MGAFTNSAITEAGRILLAEVQAGAVFTPTRLVIGSGSIPNGKTAQTITDVVAVVKSLDINKKQRTPDGKAIFGAVYSNKDITTAFYFRELALYAKPIHLNEDGSVASEGAEVLYAYGNAGNNADYMPAYSTSTVVEKQIDIVTYVGNDTQVDLTVESGIYASKTELAAVEALANGAVKKTGDTMTGELQVEVAGGKTVILPDASCTYIQSYKAGDWAHRRTLMVRNRDYSPDLASAVTLGVQDDGAWNEYALIHTKNLHLIKPEDIGAVSTDGATMHGTLNVAIDGGNAVLVSDAARAYLQTFQDGEWDKRRVLLLRNEQVATASEMLAVGANVDGEWKEYTVIHTGNMEELLGVAPATIE